MKFKRFVLLTVIWLAGCAPQQSSPTATPIPSDTPIPSPTATSTPVPTPIGGSGKLMVVVNDQIKVIDPAGNEEKVLVAQLEFEQRFSIKDGYHYRFSKFSPDGQKIAVGTCRRAGDSPCADSNLFLSTIGGSHTYGTRTLGGVPEWSPDSQNILMRAIAPKGAYGEQIFQIFRATEDNFGARIDLPGGSAAFWSYDGKLVYYYDKDWFTINNDGTNKQPLKCDICKLASEPSAYAVAQSPDGQKIGLGLMDGTVVITSTDMAYFKMGAVGSYVNHVKWAPDSTKLAVDIDVNPNESDIVIVGADGTIIKRLPRPEGVKYVSTCGWSPDSQMISYIAIRDTSDDLYLQSLDSEQPTLLLSFPVSQDSCPVWLTGNP